MTFFYIITAIVSLIFIFGWKDESRGKMSCAYVLLYLIAWLAAEMIGGGVGIGGGSGNGIGSGGGGTVTTGSNSAGGVSSTTGGDSSAEVDFFREVDSNTGSNSAGGVSFTTGGDTDPWEFAWIDEKYNLEMKIQKYETERQNLNQQIAEKEKTIQGYDVQNRNLNQRLTEQGKKIQKYETERQNLNQQIAEQDKTIQRYDVQNQDLNRQIAEQDKTIQEYDTQNQDLNRQIAEQGKTIQEYDTQKKDLSRRLAKAVQKYVTEYEDLSQQLAEQDKRANEAQEEVERLKDICDQQNEFISLLGSGSVVLHLRYTGTGDPDFSAQIIPTVQISRNKTEDFNKDLSKEFESFAGMTQFSFDRLCIENAAAAGDSQVEEAVRAAQNAFPNIQVEKIDQE